MAAAATDYFTEVGSPGTATTLAAPGHTIGGTAFTVVSTTNWPTNTGIVFAVDNYTLQTVNGVPNTAVRTAGTYTEWEGIVASSTQITGGVLRYGTDQNYSAGSLTRVYIPVASSRENRLVQGLQIQHNQDGTHGAITSTNATLTTPKVVTSINDTNSNEAIRVSPTASAVNDITVTNAATGNAPQISASGDDTNVDLKLVGKGTGRVSLSGAGAPQVATTAASSTTTNTSYAGLADAVTTSVTCTIGTSGMALVTVGSEQIPNTASALTYTAVAVSGATTIAASDTKAFFTKVSGATLDIQGSYTYIQSGLAAGSNTFTIQYRTGAGTATFVNRTISVIPL